MSSTIISTQEVADYIQTDRNLNSVEIDVDAAEAFIIRMIGPHTPENTPSRRKMICELARLSEKILSGEIDADDVVWRENQILNA